MSEESTRDRGVSITIKFGKGHEAPWLVFTGTVASVREDVISAFGLESDSVTGQTLAEIVASVSTDAIALGSVGSKLGGRVISQPATISSESTWAAAKSEPAAPVEPEKVLTILDRIEACTSVDDLKALWADKSAEISSQEGGVAAWQTKGKSLKEAA